MPDRFYIETGLEDAVVELAGAEAHHLQHVMRHSVGDVVTLFDGRGTQARAEIVRLQRQSVTLQILEKQCERVSAQGTLSLATAVPKGDRFRWLVEKVTELGIDRLIPLRTERSIVIPSAQRLSKLGQTVIAASKQCGRSRLMRIDNSMEWSDFLNSRKQEERLLVAHRDGPPVTAEPIRRLMETPQPTILVVGPEGGLTEAERSQAQQAGGDFVRLSSTILRIETAAVALAALVTSRRVRCADP